MNFDSITDRDIDSLITMPKRAVNPTAKWRKNRGSRQKDYRLAGGDYSFRLFLRQHCHDVTNFSCGLCVQKPDLQDFTLLRYNGSNHPHGEIEYKCHIHKATESMVQQGKKEDRFAEATNRYTDFSGAVRCICEDANISGLADTNERQPNLL